MTDSTSKQKSEEQSAQTGTKTVSPWRCLLGAVISGAFAIALYFLTASIVQTFAAKPISSNNPLTIKIAIAVRTLVTGMSTLGTGIFGLVAVGLVALAIQISIQRLKQPS